MPIITREKEKRFSYVTNCIHKHPLARAKSVTAYRIGSATDALYPSVPSLSTFKLYTLVNFWCLFGVYLVFILVLWGARSWKLVKGVSSENGLKSTFLKHCETK